MIASRTLAWATDVHLDHLPDAEAIASFARALVITDPDAVLLTGDITVAGRLDVDLGAIVSQVGRPIYFTLGNHDYYGSSIAEVRERVRQLCARQPLLHYLPQTGVVELGRRTALVGIDGWGDARCGDVHGSSVRLSDFVLIADLARKPHAPLVERLRELGDDEARRARPLLERALAVRDEVVFATHVPPFEQACVYEGEAPGPDDPWSPWFVCVAVGELLVELAGRHPHSTIEVYCGHTHGGGSVHIRDNLVVHTGQAEYGHPRLDRVIVAQ